jgi:hypothetical protein
MRIIITSILLVACTHTPRIKKDDPVALINCRQENSCPQADAVTIDHEEVVIDQYCSSPASIHKDFCEQRKLTSDLKMIDSAVSDLTYEVHKPLYNSSEI